MISLILLSCALSGQDCRLHVAADGLSFMTCMVQAQEVAAAYVNDHPNRVVAKMICVDDRKVEFFIGRGAA